MRGFNKGQLALKCFTLMLFVDLCSCLTKYAVRILTCSARWSQCREISLKKVSVICITLIR